MFSTLAIYVFAIFGPIALYLMFKEENAAKIRSSKYWVLWFIFWIVLCVLSVSSLAWLALEVGLFNLDRDIIFLVLFAFVIIGLIGTFLFRIKYPPVGDHPKRYM